MGFGNDGSDKRGFEQRYDSEQEFEQEQELDEEALRGEPAPGKVTRTSRLRRWAATTHRGARRVGAGRRRGGPQTWVDPFGLHLATPEQRRRGGGQAAALPGDLRARFESALATDLSDVRVHHDSAAAARAARHGARAYAEGLDIHFGAGEYDPASSDGQHLIAHEVAHVVQQTGGNLTPQPQFKLAASQAGDPVEREADRAADAMVRGDPFTLTAQPMRVAKKEPDERETARVPGVLEQAVAKVTQAGTVKATEAIIHGDSVLAQAPGVSMMATVSLKADVDPEPDEIEAGWVQTVVSSRRVAIYQKAGVTTHKSIIGFESVRDAKKGAQDPWYVPPEKLSKTKRAVFPMAEDQPKVKFPAKENGAEVTALEGSDNFLVSLKIGSSGDLNTIESFSWSAPWSVKLNGAGYGQGGGVEIGPAYSHPEPKNEGTANEAGNAAANKISTYETVEAAAAALSAGFQPFIRDLARHRRLDRGSYWNMITALWQSNVQIRVQLEPVMGSETEVPLAIVSDKVVDKGEVSTRGSYSALGHMVYDPTSLVPGHTIAISVDHQPLNLTFPYESKTFRNIEVDDGDSTINVVVSVG